ncbi:MAG: Polyprenol-phosphate-mannose-dependent alpha-(1-2)-phosphatidylinositol mannoside [Nocardia sp.]|uniref:glycosyltransferase 87 family protein n=1 Tax=Nocardia sp. TaxID=1821 RepID=UPI002627E245|nr:glycosyltransferase 87 family protein [Nocardia sp.]MCU1646457.1 Polyprenol-phosphate-mannose-dependent alpha-(1-2)-phosphatidylinositol mannoside [Nocardia sp.]
MNERSGLADPAEKPAPTPRSSTLSRQQVQLLAIAVVLFAVSAGISYAAKFWHGYIDLQVYRNGARAWLDNKDLYGPMPPVYGLGLPFTYPPLAALFFAPLAIMPLVVSEWAVLATSVISLGVTLWVVLDRLRPNLAWATRLAMVVGGVGLLELLEPIRQTYGFGQINLVLMAAIALDCLVRKPFWPRGMLIGIAVSVKLTPAGYLLYFLLRKDWKGAATLVFSTIGAVIVGFALFPHDSVQYWLHTISDTGRIGPPWFAGNQSLKGFAYRLGFSDSVATLIWLVLSVLAVALAAIWMKRLFSVGANAAALLVNAGAVLLVSPVSWSHHWVWIAPALLVAADAIARGRRSPAFLTAVGVALVMFAIGPQWLLPHDHDRELAWAWWQQIIGSSYVLFTLGAFIVAALAYHPARVSVPHTERTESPA